MLAVDIKFIRCCQSVLFLAVFMSATSCGFQLRGALEISPDVAPVYLQENSSFELAREVRQLIRTNNIAITETALSANSQLVLQGESKQSRVLSVDSDGRAREYLLLYDVDILIRMKVAGKESFDDSNERISLTRTLLFDQGAVLAVSNESAILYEDMRRQAARLIVMKLQALSVQAGSEQAGAEQAGSVQSNPGSVDRSR
jgi:LPS-assembly lipoprotein